jgi:YD repeat-containing protein
VQYQYDNAERLTRVTRADGQHWALTWDANGRINNQ